jgi:hypothetical protein
MLVDDYDNLILVLPDGYWIVFQAGANYVEVLDYRPDMVDLRRAKLISEAEYEGWAAAGERRRAEYTEKYERESLAKLIKKYGVPT